MRAAQCTSFGAPASTVTVVDLPDPLPAAGEVVVRVEAAALNFPDALIVSGEYQVRPPLPFTPGSEFAGTVTAVGAHVTAVAVGDRVTGGAFTGAFAQSVVVPEDALRHMPDELDAVDGAAYRVAYATAYHSLVTIGGAAPGQQVAVLGAAGGVGLACIDIGSRLGMQMIAATSSAERGALALERGAVAAVDYSTEDLKVRLKELSGPGVDVVVDPVGGAVAEPALRAMRWGGRFVTVGFASGTIPRIPLNLVLLKGVIIRGFELRTIEAELPGSTAAADAALEALIADGLRPHVSQICTLDQVPQVLDQMVRKHTTGKIVVDIT